MTLKLKLYHAFAIASTAALGWHIGSRFWSFMLDALAGVLINIAANTIQALFTH